MLAEPGCGRTRPNSARRQKEGNASVAKVEVYTTSYCPFCDRAKALLRRKGVKFQEIDVTDEPELREVMTTRAGGRRTVPQIFIDGKIIGGYEELKALEDADKLDPLLAAGEKGERDAAARLNPGK
jgi:glutaredoxin 3